MTIKITLDRKEQRQKQKTSCHTSLILRLFHSSFLTSDSFQPLQTTKRWFWWDCSQLLSPNSFSSHFSPAPVWTLFMDHSPSGKTCPSIDFPWFTVPSGSSSLALVWGPTWATMWKAALSCFPPQAEVSSMNSCFLEIVNISFLMKVLTLEL